MLPKDSLPVPVQGVLQGQFTQWMLFHEILHDSPLLRGTLQASLCIARILWHAAGKNERKQKIFDLQTAKPCTFAEQQDQAQQAYSILAAQG